ncbi:MAG TPA: hypothetical protein VKR99_00175, partial [Candidatus Eremiobacteraceae bacterium]|nr:hypothetical protein [Candidatus Eremiobacteraceae bacterium]
RYFPGVPAIDWARFPSVPALTEKMRRHSWRSIAFEEIVHHDTVPVAEYFARVERKYISSLHLMSGQEFAAGLATMRAKNAGRDTVARTIQATVVSGRRVRTPRGKASPAPAAKEHAVADSNKESSLARFIRDQVDPISAAFSQTPLTRLRVKTSRGAVTLVKVPPSANGVSHSTEDGSEGARAPEKLPHGARLHNPEAGRAYDTISADVVGIFRELPEPPATGERLTNGQVLGHIEALRLRNTVVCPVDCTLIAQVVDDGQPVDFGETLFVVDSGGVPLERESEPLPEAEAAQALEPVEPPRL